MRAHWVLETHLKFTYYAYIDILIIITFPYIYILLYLILPTLTCIYLLSLINLIFSKVPEIYINDWAPIRQNHILI